MKNRLPTVRVLFLCRILSSSAVFFSSDESFETFLQDIQSDADAGLCMLQVQSQQMSAVIDEAGAFHNQGESSTRQTWATLQKWSPEVSEHAKRHDTARRAWARVRGTDVQESDVISNDASSFVATISVCAMVVAGFIRMVHNSLRDAFKIMPSASVVLFLFLLGTFCWGFEVELRLSRDHMMVSNWTLVSGCIAQTILTFTPMIMLVPDQKQAETWFESCYGRQLQDKIEDWAGRNTDWISLIHLIVLSFQIASTMPVYVLAKVTQRRLETGIHAVESVGKGVGTEISPEDVATEEFVEPVMITLLYVLLSWCSLAVMYERATRKSFHEDFPNRVFQTAFPHLLGDRLENHDCKNKFDEHMKDAHEHMKDAKDILDSFDTGEMSPALEEFKRRAEAIERRVKQVQGAVEHVKQAVTELGHDFSKEADKIVASFLGVEKLINKTYCGFWIHRVVYYAYFILVVVNSFYVAICTAQKIFWKGDFILQGVYLTCALLIIYLYFGITFMLITSGAFDAESDAQNLGTQKPGVQKPGEQEPAAQALILAPTRTSVSAAVPAENNFMRFTRRTLDENPPTQQPGAQKLVAQGLTSAPTRTYAAV